MCSRLLVVILLSSLWTGAGCAVTSKQPVPNPLFVRANNPEGVWERTVDVVHDYFFIQREDRLDGVMETKYKVGSSLLEPWQRDSVGVHNRLESTLQSIRRKAFVTVTSTEEGFLVGVEVFKELEDVPGTNSNAPGGATFRHFIPLQRDLDIASDRPIAANWIPQGRDQAAEQEILQAMQLELSQ